jgi:hypothetical protein
VNNRVYKLEYPFTNIDYYTFRKVTIFGSSVLIHLRHPPNIFQRLPGSDSFYPCNAFDPNYKSFQELNHILEGDLEVFGKQFEILESTESFMNRQKARHVEQKPEPLICKEDETFTDSGYASVLNTRYDRGDNGQNHELSGQNLESKAPPYEVDTEDTRTVLSMATTMNSRLDQDSIDWVCDNIYGSLCHTIDAVGYKTLKACFPGLLKAFAIKFGTDASDPSHLRIMHFVYKRHK